VKIPKYIVITQSWIPWKFFYKKKYILFFIQKNKIKNPKIFLGHKEISPPAAIDQNN
jgi:hypothetical protein